MTRLIAALFMLSSLSLISFTGQAELQDQGLNSVLQIIDKAILDINGQESDEEVTESSPESLKNATAAIVTLSKTLGSLSFSRLQCGEAEVLAEFTQRVQQMPESSRDSMRNAFQEGFDKSRDETALLSEDECKRLTQSRIRSESINTTNVVEEAPQTPTPEETAEPEVEAVLEEPRMRHLRIAELSGQLAYKRKVCDGDKVFNRDYNAFLETVPEEYLEEVKSIYWKGYKHGKRMNPNLTRNSC